MTLALDLVGSLWARIGPGLILAAALPFLMVALGLIVRTGFQRARVAR
jgi:hypothetical protein